ncbi:Putative pentatricopeptide repeat-containing protein [Apostasia shenzhenica]|uniref:Pentatricopeptide repeat-containing protein n=1 Tax=Apostasia shenzhenica TaxID=1088818 RepID=A0A2I0A6G6_9ASPA|nr:Putative pentatricopeptide repeat-containing protein [Apostasia shenzhenica]
MFLRFAFGARCEKILLSLPAIPQHRSPQPLTVAAAYSGDTYPWNARLRELAADGLHSEAIALFRHMLLSPNPRPDAFTYPCAIGSAAALSLPSTVASLHSLAVKSGSFPADPFVLSSLLSAYASLSRLPLAYRLLHQISSPDSPTPISTLVVCYNSVISGHSFPSDEALFLFSRMLCLDLPFNSITLLALIPVTPLLAVPTLHALTILSGFKSDPAVANCLITSYSKTGDIGVARQVFDEMLVPRELISWNAMISACAQNGLARDVLDLYVEMGRSGEARPDPVTLVSVLSSCASLGAHTFGISVERSIEENKSFISNIFLQNALINMHARCGNLTRARALFDEMPQRSLVSWTAIISGFGMHGHGDIALHLFDRMLLEGIRPDGVLMVSVLSACSHAGLAQRGMHYFSIMETAYGVQRRQEHFACMVDLLGRGGKLKEALELIRSMPMVADGAVWGALLGSCKIHKNVEYAEMAFNHVVELEPSNVGYYVLLSNVYLDAGILDGVARIRSMMRRRGLKKDPGCSYMELKGRVHMFMADDHSHPQAKRIYKKLFRLERLVKEDSAVGKVGNLNWVGIHSEKLAVAFGLLNAEGSEIKIMKNLRICEDCHLFIKLVSKIADRRFVVRDASRFHHFQGGSCSCKDYW